MSETSCNVNPLQRFANLTNNDNNARIGQYGNGDLITGSSDAINARNESTERSFFNGGSVMNTNVAPSYIPLDQGTSMTNNNNIHNFSHMHTSNNDNVELALPDLSKVQIHDPLEFSDEYKKFYGSYQANNEQSNNRPSIQRFPQFGMDRPFLQTSASEPMIRQFRDIHNTAGINGNCASGMHFQQPDNAQIHVIDHELDIFEQELSSEPSVVVRTQSQPQSAFDGEQIHFKEVAASIVQVVTPDTTRSSSPVSNKLNGSKFMQLMKKVSAGSVTLRRDSPELFTPETDEVVGNEYFPVHDHPQK